MQNLVFDLVTLNTYLFISYSSKFSFNFIPQENPKTFHLTLYFYNLKNQNTDVNKYVFTYKKKKNSLSKTQAKTTTIVHLRS